MTLRRKILLMTTIILTSLIMLIYTASQAILLQGFARLEEQDMARNVERALNALFSQLNLMATHMGDWAYWDDTYLFVQDGNQDYIDANLYNNTFATLGINMMLFFNTQDELVYAKAVDLYSGQDTHIPRSLPALLVNGPLLNYPETARQMSGILVIPEGPVLVAATPILTSLEVGPSQGTLIWGRYLDFGTLQELATLTNLALTLHLFYDPQVPDDVQAARVLLSADTPVHIQTLNATTIAGYALLHDIAGDPALILRVDAPRRIYQQGQVSVSYFVLALVLVGAMFGGGVLWLLEREVLSRLARLSSRVTEIGQHSDPSARVIVSGSDELSRLGDSINQMLGALEKSQATLRQSEERLRTVVSNAPVILFALDREGRFTFLQGRRLGTVDSDALIGRSVFELYQDSPEFRERFRRALDGEDSTWSVMVADRTFDLRYFPLRDADEKAVGIIGVANDVTERIRAEVAEREQRVLAEAMRDTAAALAGTLDFRELLEQILANLDHIAPHDAAVIMLIEDGFARPVACRGYAERGLEEVALSLRFDLAGTPDLRQMVETRRALVIPDTRAYPGWVDIPEMRWVHAYVGAPIRHEHEIAGILSLVSERVGAFTQIHADNLQTFADHIAVALHNAQLYESEQYQRLLAQTLQKTSEALSSSTHLEDTLRLIVKELGRLIHYDRAIMMLVEEDYLHVAAARGFDDREFVLGSVYNYTDDLLLRDAMSTDKPLVLADVQQDARWAQWPGFEPATRSWIGMPLVARDVVTGFLSIASNQPNAYAERDVEAVTAFAQQAALAVENARILAELESSLNDLQIAQASLARTVRLSTAGQIAAGVAHQINNPLTTVIAETHLLLKHTPPDSADYKALVAIREAAHRAGAVVQRFLNLSRSTPYVTELLDVNHSLQTAVSLVRAQVEPHVARLIVSLAPRLPLIDGSVEHLIDVWINLLINARDAIDKPREGIIQVSSALNDAGDAIVVRVQDNGKGIAPEHLGHIFEPFFTTKDYGTGLGLSICQDVIAQHGGTMRVESEAGHGATFIVTLPVQAGTSPTDED